MTDEDICDEDVEAAHGRYAQFPESAAVRELGSDIVLLPMGHDNEGRGLYESDAVFAVKRLRAAGAVATFFDPPGQRMFDVRNSAVLTTIGMIVVGIVTNAAYDGLKKLLRSNQTDSELEIRLLDVSSDSPSMKVLRGNREDVLAALNALDPNSAATFMDTSDSEEQTFPSVDHHWDQEVNDRLDNARTSIEIAKETLAAPGDHAYERAEEHARSALASMASALNYAEDSPREALVHQTMDEAGKWVRRTFGCAVGRDGTSYFQECPVAIAHRRVGFSVGGFALKICSICGSDVSECEHLPDHTYSAAGGAGQSGRCPVCVEVDCDHSPDIEYDVTLTSIVVELAIDEVSIVGKPAFPDARVSRYEIDIDEMSQELGSKFVPGMEVTCSRCLEPCGGLVKPFDAPGS